MNICENFPENSYSYYNYNNLNNYKQISGKILLLYFLIFKKLNLKIIIFNKNQKL